MISELATALREYISHPANEKALVTDARWQKVLAELQAEENAPKPPAEPLNYYLGLHYPITIHQEPDGGGFVAEVKDLPGCFTQAEALGELWALARDAISLWIRVAYEHGDKIPLPSRP